MALIFLQVEDNVELHQMPKRSRRDDVAKLMIGGLGAKSSNTAAASKAASKSKGKGKGKPINIPLTNISPELKKILVREMVKGGGQKLLKRVRLRDRVNKGQGK